MSDHVCPRCGAGHSSRPDPEYEDAAPSAEPHRSFTARQQLAAQGDFAAPAPAAEPTTGEAVKSAISAAKRDFWTVREDGVTLPAAAPSAGPCPRTFDGKHDTGGTVCAYCGKQMAAPSAGAGNATALESRLRRIASGEWTLSGDEGYLVQAANELARLRTESEQLREEIKFLHGRRGELVIERDRYKAALGQYPEGRDVFLGGALAEIERLREELGKPYGDLLVQTYDAIYERDAAVARAERLQDCVRHLLPMAKGWACIHPVGQNELIVADAAAILDAVRAGTADKGSGK